MSVVRNTRWYLWPLAAVWDVLALLLEITGRMLGIALAIVMMAAGIILTMTVNYHRDKQGRFSNPPIEATNDLEAIIRLIQS